MPAHLIYVNAKVQELQGALLSIYDRLHVARLPPQRTSSQQSVGIASKLVVSRRICEFFIPPEGDHRLPFVRADQFVHFHANQGIRAHPGDLLADGGKAVETIAIVNERHRSNVGLAFIGAGQSSNFRTLQELYAGLASHFLDQHVGHLK